jgi:hypothetical protein
MLSAASLLDAWECAVGEQPLRRVLLLLAAAHPARSAEELARLPVGRRDALLLDLREAAFGSRLDCTVACPACGALLEFSCAVSDLRSGDAGDPATPLRVHRDGYQADFRLPTTHDLLAVEPHPERAAAARSLLARCLDVARRDGAIVPAESLPDDLVEEIERRMASADPQADTRVELSCPGCGHRWVAAFDIVSFLWSEVSAWATRTLGEVHGLARAYGWTEGEILRLSARRRRLYLEMSYR